jgi:hypothetical protein
LVFCPPSIRAGGGATILSARAWRNSPHTPLPPCPRSDGRNFRRRLKLAFHALNQFSNIVCRCLF